MQKRILDKIRRLNHVLTESTTGVFSYDQLSKILSEVINANVYIVDAEGNVLGTGYTDAEDTSTVIDEEGSEKLKEQDTMSFLKINETKVNITGEEVLNVLGDDYGMADKYHGIIPSFCGGERLGTLIVARYNQMFDEEDIALCEYGAAVVGLEIQRNNRLKREEEMRENAALDMALESLSFSEKDAMCKIFQEFDADEGTMVISKVAGKYKITNSVMVNTLRKLESAGVLTSYSLGMKGTRIKIKNPYFRQRVRELSQ